MLLLSFRINIFNSFIMKRKSIFFYCCKVSIYVEELDETFEYDTCVSAHDLPVWLSLQLKRGRVVKFFDIM